MFEYLHFDYGKLPTNAGCRRFYSKTKQPQHSSLFWILKTLITTAESLWVLNAQLCFRHWKLFTIDQQQISKVILKSTFIGNSRSLLGKHVFYISVFVSVAIFPSCFDSNRFAWDVSKQFARIFKITLSNFFALDEYYYSLLISSGEWVIKVLEIGKCCRDETFHK